MKNDRKNWFYALLALVFFGVMWVYAKELFIFSRYLDSKKLVLTSLVFGLIAGIGLGWLAVDNQKEIYEKIRLGLGAIVLTIAFSPLLLSLFNRGLAKSEPETLEAVLAGHEARFTSRFGVVSGKNAEPNQHHYFFYLGPKLRRITVSAPIWDNYAPGDTVPLAIKRGALGWDWIALK